MFNVKNTTMPVRESNIITIKSLKSLLVKEHRDHEDKVVKRDYSIFLTGSDGKTRTCHLYRYEGDKVEFVTRIKEAYDNQTPIILLSYGGFDPARWFGEFEEADLSDNETDLLDIALQQAFTDLNSMV